MHTTLFRQTTPAENNWSSYALDNGYSYIIIITKSTRVTRVVFNLTITDILLQTLEQC